MVADASAPALPDSPGFMTQQQDAATPAGAAQQSSSSSASDTQPAKGDAPTAKSAASGEPQQTKRILNIMPNFSAVSADTTLPPQTPKDKFVMAAKNSFDYSSFLLAAIQSGMSMESKSYPEFGQGAKGYAKYYYHTLLDTADENFMVSGVTPVIFRQDNRFYTMGHGGVGKRILYAASRVLITRTDSGGQAFNASEIIGAGAASALSTAYYPATYRTWTKVGQRWLTSCVIDSASFTFKEFWPDINHKIFHTK